MAEENEISNSVKEVEGIFLNHLESVIGELKVKVAKEEYDKIIEFLKLYISPHLNDLTQQQIIALEDCINNFKVKVDTNKYKDAIRYCDWLNTKLDINLMAANQEQLRQKDKDKFHPIRPRRGEVYLANLGENIGKEINDQHLVMIIQNNKGNLYANTVVCIPISSSGKLYPTHEKIEQEDIKQGRLDKLPSKAKTEQIQYLDKARLIHKVAELQPDKVDKIGKRVKKNLDIR
ncbi:MAG: type II toxin-antitoxin system PemK/MazF family toxin [Niameybacter sp.]|nr:type II toxin-antitoxin system PemK/MazF family toxin [Niameybacter sp.]